MTEWYHSLFFVEKHCFEPSGILRQWWYHWRMRIRKIDSVFQIQPYLEIYSHGFHVWVSNSVRYPYFWSFAWMLRCESEAAFLSFAWQWKYWRCLMFERCPFLFLMIYLDGHGMTWPIFNQTAEFTFITIAPSQKKETIFGLRATRVTKTPISSFRWWLCRGIDWTIALHSVEVLYIYFCVNH